MTRQNEIAHPYQTYRPVGESRHIESTGCTLSEMPSAVAEACVAMPDAKRASSTVTGQVRRTTLPAIKGEALHRRFNGITVAITALVFSLLMTACNLDRLGDAAMNRSQYNMAIPCYEIMTIVESGCGTRSIRLADAWTNLGICYAKLCRNEEALRVQELAVEMRRGILESRT
jgi:hypothetical protein